MQPEELYDMTSCLDIYDFLLYFLWFLFHNTPKKSCNFKQKPFFFPYIEKSTKEE